jgi:ACDE family multidrug resistance protein
MDRAKEFVTYAAAFTGPVAGNSVLALLGTLSESWGVSNTEVLLSIPAFMFPFAVVQLFSGTISDAYDRRATTAFGLAVYAGGCLLAALSGSLGFFLVTRVVQGIGYAFVSPVLVAILSDIAGPGRQGLAMGYYGSSTTAGVAVGPLLAGVLAETDWRLAFVGIGAIALVVLIAFLAVFRKEVYERGSISSRIIAKQLGTVTRNPGVALVSAAGFMTFLAFVGILSFTADHLDTSPLGISSAEIGVALSVSGLVGIMFSPVSGRLVDRSGPRCCAAVGFSILAVSSAMLQFSTEYFHFVSLLALNGLGSSFVWSSLLVMVVRAHPSMKGTASSVFNSARFAGYALSPIVLTPLFQTGGFPLVVNVCVAFGMLAMLLALASGPLQKRAEINYEPAD